MFTAQMPVLLDSDGANGTQFNGDVTPGKYSYIGMFFDVSLDTAETLVASELGRLRMSEQGRDLVNIDIDNLRDINMLEGGAGFLDSNTGSDGECIVLIPRRYGNDNNAHLVTEQDLLKIEINMTAAYDTAVTGGVIEIYGCLSETGEHNYNLKFLQFAEVIGASAVQTIRITEENVIALYVVGDDTDALRVRIMRDGEVVANCSLTAARAISELLNETDSLTIAVATDGDSEVHANMAKFAFAGEGEIGEFLSDAVQLEFTEDTTGATEQIVVCSADFSPAKLRQTKVETASVMERKLARKHKLNRSRPIQSLKVQAS